MELLLRDEMKLSTCVHSNWSPFRKHTSSERALIVLSSRSFSCKSPPFPPTIVPLAEPWSSLLAASNCDLLAVKLSITLGFASSALEVFSFVRSASAALVFKLAVRLERLTDRLL